MPWQRFLQVVTASLNSFSSILPSLLAKVSIRSLISLSDPALQDVALRLAHLAEGGAGRVDADALLDGDLQDFALLVLVDVLVVVGAQLDLFHEPAFHFIEGHAKAPLHGEVGRHGFPRPRTG